MISVTRTMDESRLSSLRRARRDESSVRTLAVAVFCGAKLGSDPQFSIAAKSLAEALHIQGWTLVYGAGTVGLMGEVSRTLVELSGPQSVHGIIPEALVAVERKRNPDMSDSKRREESYGSVTVVQDMHARKTLMAKAAGAFVALPGGFGTMEEVMEIITWNFLGIHDKPIVLFNVGGFYDDILRWVRRAVKERFVDQGNANIVVEATTANEVIEAIKNYRVATSRHDLEWAK